jgi:regulator of RNase E activity RraA
MSGIDTYAIAKMYKYLRVCDVSDALDAIGRPDIMLMDPAMRPIFQGIKFWGPAVTERIIPANKLMRAPLTRQEAVDSHRLWFEDVGRGGDVSRHIKPGCVVVTDAQSCGEVGRWGSMNALTVVHAGAVGIMTDGCARDTAELLMSRTPVVRKQRARTIIPGRNFFTNAMEPVGCGGVLVRPGDIVGCDDDGCLCVPAEVAEEVGKIASDILIDDEKKRRTYYEKLGIALDDSVDVELLEEFYKPWN